MTRESAEIDALKAERDNLRRLLRETSRWAAVYSGTLINVFHAKGVDGWLSIQAEVEAALRPE